MDDYTQGQWEYSAGSIYANTTDRGRQRIIMADRNNPEISPIERDENVKRVAIMAVFLEGWSNEELQEFGSLAAALYKAIQEARESTARGYQRAIQETVDRVLNH